MNWFLPKKEGRSKKPNEVIDIEQFISVKGIKALGNQLTPLKVKKVTTLEPLPFEEPEETPANDIEVVDEESLNNQKENNEDEKGDNSQGTLF